MQIPKTRNGSSEVPGKSSLLTLKSKCPTKVTGSESNTSSSTNSSKLLTDRSPKIECRTDKTMETEKRRSSKVTELECQIARLQDDLKKTRDQLNCTESWKRRAQQESEEAKKQLLVMALKLEDSKSQMMELSAAEESRIQELRKISQERDRAWQSELEAIQNQHSIDTAALASAMTKIRRLKLQLEMVLRSEAALKKKPEVERIEMQSSKRDLAEVSFTIENLRLQLISSEKAEAEAKSMLAETRKQLEVAQSTIEALLTDGSKLMESFSIVATELKESRSPVKSLEETMKRLQEEQFIAHLQALAGFGNPKRICFGSLDSEVEQLMSALEDAWIKNQQEQIESTVKIQCTREMMEKMSTDSRLRQSELKLRLIDTESEVTVLKSNLFDKEEELQRISDMNKKLLADIEEAQENKIESELGLKLTKSIADAKDLKSKLTNSEIDLQRLSEENEQLKSELRRTETESHKACEAAIAEMKSAKAAEEEALMKLGSISDKAEKNNRRATRVTEELEAVQAVKSEMEAELRKLKVQAEQWRKAAETAIVMLTADNNGKFAGAVDSEYKSAEGKLMSLRFSDDIGEESSRKKNSSRFYLSSSSFLLSCQLKPITSLFPFITLTNKSFQENYSKSDT
ncbi:Interactor of constitutive active ROPs, partial [Musa troglodytarum]